MQFKNEPFSLVHCLPFAAVHVAVLGVLFVHFRWWYPLLAVGLYGARMFFVTAGYHRYFSHRTFKTSRAFQFLLAFSAMTSLQKGVLWWAAHHRHHHRFSDLEEDIHSPSLNGFWWSHLGWILSKRYNTTRAELVPDLARYPELRWLNKYHMVPGVTLAAVLFLTGGLSVFLWGFCVSTVMLWHGTFTINSLCHVFGRRRYATNDTSRNSLILSLITMGEGWHNNHHRYMSSVRQGFFWWEIDLTYYILKMLSWVHIVWDLKMPPPALLHPVPAES
ncbi:MAG TPA: acyl-CoA desaturase [Candidatus Acidoferrales bacterium]|nr:acyl-CoA desaturase [Candidatus Acidoferrales bacterium]